MRITNNMIVSNSKSNINSNKVSVDKYNTQMSTQKKISRASEDPVVAIRSLRLSTTQTHLNQYSTNIHDAQSWLDVTETALINMKKILTDIRTQCVNGSTDTLTADDRNTILKQLTALSEQVYSEGNADYAGRTIFTGYRTSSNLTFDKAETATTYEISQTFSSSDMEEHRYYSGDVTVPATITPTSDKCEEEIACNSYQRIRLAYGTVDYLSSLEVTLADGKSIDVDMEAGTITSTQTIIEADGGEVTETDTYGSVSVYDSYEEWEEAAGGQIADENEIVVIKSTGEIVFGHSISSEFLNENAEISVSYVKTGFEKGEVRPEYYYDCRDVSEAMGDDGKIDETLAAKYAVDYTKENQEISYTIATNTTLTINTQAGEVFDTSIKRDVDEMITVVNDAIAAHEKVESIKQMMSEVQYSDVEYQEILQTYLDAAQKEADYADDNLQKTYSAYITNFDNYLQNTNLAITNVGSTMSRLQLTQTRVENQQTSVEELKSTNEDRDISDIIIDYYAAYNAYTASLTAASKVGDQTLLNYL